MLRGKFYVDKGPVYDETCINSFIDEILEDGDLPLVTKRKGKKTYKLYNVPCAFDIETTSIIVNDSKTAFMYVWMFGINGISIYGRTWDTFLSLVGKLVDRLGLNEYRRLVCYVHNLEFEFQFIRKLFEWDETFALDERRPIYAITSDGIEFRCSYMLTNSKLEKVGENLIKFKCKKLVGNLKYSKCRHSKTKLSDKEMRYNINDIRVVMCKIAECLEDEDISTIPLTSTGYVRRDIRKRIQKSKGEKDYISSLTLEVDEYNMLKRAFQGGFTHANCMHSNMTMYDVDSYDFTSSYPTVLLGKMPVSKGVKVEVKSNEEFLSSISSKFAVFDIMFENVRLKDDMGDAPLSASKCFRNGRRLDSGFRDVIIDNGRIRECDSLITTITDQDFYIIRDFYDYDSFTVSSMYVYEKGYLPKSIIEAVLDYYEGKTQLKDVEGKEYEYQLSKALLNAIFGMFVMDPCKPHYLYDGNSWGVENSSVEDMIDSYNNSKSRTTFYPWGVWCTAIARRNLFTGIYECGDDYIYSDTDSMKIQNASDHMEYINAYNETIKTKLYLCLDYYGIDHNRISPRTKDGEIKTMGVWDFDGHYDKFKTLGAKKYLTYSDKKGYKLTCAGVSKEAVKYISSLPDPFESFEDGLCIPSSHTHKLTHTYIDDRMELENVVDYQGNVIDKIVVESSIHLDPVEFTINLSDEYLDLLEALNLGCEESFI